MWVNLSKGVLPASCWIASCTSDSQSWSPRQGLTLLGLQFFTSSHINYAWLKEIIESGWEWMRSKTQGYLNAFCYLQAEIGRLRKLVLTDCLHLSLCSSFPRLMQCLEMCNLYTTQVVTLIHVWLVIVRDYDFDDIWWPCSVWWSDLLSI